MVALLGEKAVPFSEVSAHRATLEQAYMELTRQAVEFRPAGFDTQAGQEVRDDDQAISVPRPDAGPGDGPGGGGFGALLRAEWTKFRSVRGWVIGMILAALLTVLLRRIRGRERRASAARSTTVRLKTGKACLPYVPHGPGGEVVTDSFAFARQPLTGNGTLTARVVALTGEHANLGGEARSGRRAPTWCPAS